MPVLAIPFRCVRVPTNQSGLIVIMCDGNPTICGTVNGSALETHWSCSLEVTSKDLTGALTVCKDTVLFPLGFHRERRPEGLSRRDNEEAPGRTRHNSFAPGLGYEAPVAVSVSKIAGF